jgi:hypothetical protein
MNRELVFTAYNRPYYLNPTVDTWNEARGIDRWNTTVFIDPSELTDQTIDAARRLNTDLLISVNKQKLGVLKNPWNALDFAFTYGADFVILAEDDVAVSQDILEYFTWASEKYVNHQEVLCVNAFSQLNNGSENEVTKDRTFSPLVWGIWKNRWNNLLKDTWDKDYSTGKPDGSEAGWDWNINRIIKREDMLVIKPLHSRSDHLGEHGGTHMTPDWYSTSRGTNFNQIRGQQQYTEI